MASFYLQRERAVLERLKTRLRNQICMLDGEAAQLKTERDDLRGLVHRLRRENAALEHELTTLRYERLIEDTEQPVRNRPAGLLHPAPDPSAALDGHHHPLSA
jgi:regulator of replication initiation timing